MKKMWNRNGSKKGDSTQLSPIEAVEYSINRTGYNKICGYMRSQLLTKMKIASNILMIIEVVILVNDSLI